MDIREMWRTISYFTMGVDDSTGLLRGQIIDVGTLMVVRHGGEPQDGSPQGQADKSGPRRRQGKRKEGVREQSVCKREYGSDSLSQAVECLG